MMTKPTYEELQAHIERLRSVLTPKAIELIQRGISANYSGEYYCEAINEFYDPIFTVLTETPAGSLAALKTQWNCPTIENGQNRYGLDVAYFRRLFNRELNRSLSDYKPSELARNLLRMARTADSSIIAENEFTGELKNLYFKEGLLRSMEFFSDVLRDNKMNTAADLCENYINEYKRDYYDLKSENPNIKI